MNLNRKQPKNSYKLDLFTCSLVHLFTSALALVFCPVPSGVPKLQESDSFEITITEFLNPQQEVLVLVLVSLFRLRCGPTRSGREKETHLVPQAPRRGS